MSVRHLHAVLHRALQQATRWGLVARNVADFVDTTEGGASRDADSLARTGTGLPRRGPGRPLPCPVRPGPQHRHEARRASGAALAGCGPRPWHRPSAGKPDVPASLTITEPKTAASRRQVGLTPSAVAALRRHRVAQTEERLRFGSVWQDNGLVFSRWDVGEPIDATHVTVRPFRRLLKRAGLPRIRFHDLRHTAATLLLGQGVHPKVVSRNARAQPDCRHPGPILATSPPPCSDRRRMLWRPSLRCDSVRVAVKTPVKPSSSNKTGQRKSARTSRFRVCLAEGRKIKPPRAEQVRQRFSRPPP